MAQQYKGNAAATTLAAGITDVATTITITDATNWPTADFVCTIGRGTALEEVIYVGSRTGTTLSTVTRGYADSSNVAHSLGATVEHTLDATTLQRWENLTAELAGAINTAGDLAVADGNDSLTTLAKGSNSTVLGVNSGGTLGYTTVTSAMIADDTIVNGDINSSAGIAYSKLNLSGSVAQADLASGLRATTTCTSGTRPGSPSEGDLIYETDTDKVQVYSGSTWMPVGPLTAWTTWSPTVSGTGWGLGNAIIDGRYMKVGRTVHCYWRIEWGSTSTFGSGGLNVNGLPFSSDQDFAALLKIDDVGSNIYFGSYLVGTTGTGGSVTVMRSSGTYVDYVNVTSTVPHTWVSGDALHSSFTYESET